MINVAFAGRAGSGKDTAAEFLIRKHGYYKVSFAEPIKRTRRAMFPDLAERDPLSRIFDQEFGCLCRKIDPDIWVNKLVEESAMAANTAAELNGGILPESFGLVCTDVRFANEAKKLKELGWMIVGLWTPHDVRVARLKERDGAGFDENRLGHQSEQSVDTVFDECAAEGLAFCNVRTQEALWSNIEALLKRHGWKAA